MKTSVSALAALLLLAGTVAQTARAQATTTQVSGVVTDSTGVPAHDVMVVVDNVGTGQRRSTKTARDGSFRFDGLPVGRYRISTSSGRLGSAPSREIEIGIDNANTINLRIGAEGAAADGAVTAEPVAVSEKTAQLSADFNQPYVQYLPQSNLLARNGEASGAYNLSLLPPGVTSGSSFQIGQGPAVVGQRPIGNNFHIDGADNNNRIIPGQLVYVPNEATSDFGLFQSQSSPVFGHSTGGKFDNIVRTGANEFHGAIYDYLQNRNLNAVDRSFSRIGITDNPRYDQNRLGGSAGFPVLPGKIFFFGNFEYIPFGFENPMGSISYAPTTAGFAALAATPGVSATNLGILSSSTGTVTPVPGLATAVGRTTVPLGYISTLSRGYQNQYVGTGAVDWVAGSSDQIRFRYTENAIDSSTGGGLPVFASPYQRTAVVGSASWARTFTPALTNELRLSYNRFNNEAQPNASGLFPALFAFPNISIQDIGLSLGPQYGMSAYGAMNTYQLADNVRWNIRSHTIHIGFDGRRSITSQSGFATGAGVYGYSNMARYLFDLAPDVTSQRAFGSDYYSGNMWTLFPYIQDTWKMRQNLTVDLGLGWQYATIPSGVQQQSLNAGASLPGAGLLFTNPDTQKHNFAPRVGFAWSPDLKRQTVVRAGFGMNYDTLQGTPYLGPVAPQLGATVYGNLTSVFPGFLARGGLATPYAPVAAGTTGLRTFTPAAAAGLTGTYFPNQQVPYTMQWNFAVQQSVWRNFTAEVKYMGARGIHQARMALLNAESPVTAATGLPLFTSAPTTALLNALPTPTLGTLASTSARPLAGAGFTSPIQTIVPDGVSTYNGLGVTLNQRFAGGFQMLADYTWSHLIDNSTGTPLDFAFGRQRGNSPFDRRHRASVTALFDVAPLFKNTYSIVRNVFANVTLSGTYLYESPQYLPVESGLNAGLTGLSYGSAIFNPAGTPGTSSGVVPLTNSAGATVAYLATTPSAMFIRPGLGSYATGPRSAFPLQATNNFDISLVKGFAYRERFRFEVRGDAYNIFNHTQFTGTNIHNLNGNSTNAAVMNYTPSFLLPGNAEFGNLAGAMTSHPRLLQVALRLTF